MNDHTAAPFIIPLDPDTFLLPAAQLRFLSQLSSQPSREEICIYGVIKSYLDGTLRIDSHFRGVRYLHTIGIEKDRLLVSCSCGADQLCAHSKGLLSHLAQHRGLDYFKQFYSFPC